uniref:Uncharacterized protein n=1 Tax=Tetraselmis sp. GSL018 TaxID=582737 RepID=A0A061R9V4_9CHLO
MESGGLGVLVEEFLGAHLLQVPRNGLGQIIVGFSKHFLVRDGVRLELLLDPGERLVKERLRLLVPGGRHRPPKLGLDPVQGRQQAPLHGGVHPNGVCLGEEVPHAAIRLPLQLGHPRVDRLPVLCRRPVKAELLPDGRELGRKVLDALLVGLRGDGNVLSLFQELPICFLVPLEDIHERVLSRSRRCQSP